MPDSIFLSIQLGTVQVVENAIHPWQSAGGSAALSREVEAIVRACLDYPEKMQSAWDASWSLFVQGVEEGLADSAPEGEYLDRYFQASVRVLARLQQWAGRMAAAGYPIPSADQLEHALAQARQVRRTARDSLSVLDPNFCLEAHRVWRAGEYPSARAAVESLLATRQCLRIPGLEPEAISQAAQDMDEGRGRRLEDVMAELGD